MVDGAEDALRSWLSPGRHRPGDRLPPEHELSAMLGISRGTLRSALERLERGGEIVRRQGSGTFVGHVSRPPAFLEGLERLVSYAQLARDRGVKLTVSELLITREELSGELAQSFGVDPGRETTRIKRTLLADGEPSAIMEDVVHPDIALPSPSRLNRALLRGAMVMDVLIAQGVPIAFAHTRIAPRLLAAGEQNADALRIDRDTATLELEATYHLTAGDLVQHSRDLFAPNRLDLHVMRWLDARVPAAVAGH